MKFECAPIAIRSPVMSYAPPSSSPSFLLLPLPALSSTLLLSLAQLSLSGTFFRCGKRKCNKRSRQLALAKMNVIHSFTHSFIHSLNLAFVVVASLCILRMQLSLESGSIVRSCTPSLLLSFPSSLYLCEPVKLITIYIVYRLVLRFALSLFRSLRHQINSMFFNSIFKYFTRPNAWSPRCSPFSSILPFPQCYLSLCSVIMRNFFNISLLIVRG